MISSLRFFISTYFGSSQQGSEATFTEETQATTILDQNGIEEHVDSDATEVQTKILHTLQIHVTADVIRFIF